MKQITIADVPPDLPENRERRFVQQGASTAGGRFRGWLRQHRRALTTAPLAAVLARYRECVSVSAAYRAAVAEGLRGHRHNRTRYAKFWLTINWKLPDTILESIWGVSRQNLRQRRRRQGVKPPRWKLPGAASNAAYREAVRAERRQSRAFTGARPH